MFRQTPPLNCHHKEQSLRIKILPWQDFEECVTFVTFTRTVHIGRVQINADAYKQRANKHLPYSAYHTLYITGYPLRAFPMEVHTT